MRFLNDRRGIESTEVALIIAAVVLVAYGAYVILGANISATVLDVAGKV
jgi:Flp pilus assembly pilin Flp